MIVELRKVGRIFDWDWAVRDVNATIGPGEVVCVLGANGSGKSTLLKLISGALRPTSGCVRMDGRRVRLGAISLRQRMLLIEPDQPKIGDSPISHLGAAISLYGKDEPGIENVAARWLDEFSLPATNSQQARLSRGQRTKLWLATMFTLQPELWLLDEPHQCGLDAHGVEVLESQIGSHRESGGTVIFTSQWPPHARRLADRIIVLDHGAMAFAGSADQFSHGMESNEPGLAAVARALETTVVGGDLL